MKSTRLIFGVSIIFVLLQCSQPNEPKPGSVESPWTLLSPMATARSGISPVGVDGNIYVFGGLVEFTFGSHAALVYNCENQSWSELADLPVDRCEHSAVVLGPKIYVIGGFHTGWRAYNQDLLAYNLDSNSWETLAPMASHFGQTATAVFDGKIYVFGGQLYPIFASNITQVYDPAADTWETKRPMPTARCHAAAAVIDSLIYVMGGRVYNGDCFSVNEAYSPLSDKWYTFKELPEERAGHSLVSVDNKLWLFGGHSNKKMLATCREYDPATNGWSDLESMKWPRHSTSAVVQNDKIYVMGGTEIFPPGENDFVGITNTVQAFLLKNK